MMRDTDGSSNWWLLSTPSDERWNFHEVQCRSDWSLALWWSFFVFFLFFAFNWDSWEMTSPLRSSNNQPVFSSYARACVLLSSELNVNDSHFQWRLSVEKSKTPRPRSSFVFLTQSQRPVASRSVFMTRKTTLILFVFSPF